jgi:hypothetical protein
MVLLTVTAADVLCGVRACTSGEGEVMGWRVGEGGTWVRTEEAN